ncbi:MAG: hypothetical protein AB7L92_00775 [Alphaproteobacteria bacterium]
MSSAALRAFFFGRSWRNRPYLISPFFDFMMSGGLAIIVIALILLLLPPQAADFDRHVLFASVLMAYLAYLVNDPHFMVSYQLLYDKFPERLQRLRHHRELYLRTLAAGVFVPVLMLGYFCYALALHDARLMNWAFTAMMLIVGWHYTKQAFGVFIMLSAVKKVFYPQWQRLFFLVNSYVVWIVYCISALSYNDHYDDYIAQVGGLDLVPLTLFTLNADATNIVGGVFVFFALGSLLLAVWDRKNPAYSKTGLLGYLSMYYLLLSAALHPMLILVYPFFHSLQYLLFVYAYRRGEAGHKLSTAQDEMQRSAIRWQVVRSVGLALVLGVVFFFLFPALLEQWFNSQQNLFLPVTAAFIIFINIHHYFIDNVLWRKENEEVGRYLFFDKKAAV